MEPDKTQESINGLARLLAVLNKHVNEKDCKHSFMEVIKETWYLEEEMKNNEKSV